MARVQFVAAWLVVLASHQLVSTAPITVITAPTSDREALAPVFGKKFVIDNCDNMVEALQAFGIDKTLSEAAAKAYEFTLMLNENNGEYTLSSDSYIKLGNFPFKLGTSRIPFRIGQEVEIINYDGERVKVIYTQDTNILTEFREGKNPITTIRTFTPEQVKITVKVKGVVNNCVYKPNE